MPRQAILLLTDTQGVGVLGCYGRPEMGTPEIDRMAEGGLRFTRASTTQPVCGPARSALFTGLYPHTAGVLANDQALGAEVRTLGERLQREGVATGYIGKWHLDGSDYFGTGICPPGWDPQYWFDGRCYLASLPDRAARDLSRRMLDATQVAREGVEAEFTMARRITDRARRFLRAHRGRDFLLVVSIDEPHHPFICPEPFVSSAAGLRYRLGPNVEDDLAGKPLGQQEWADYMARRGPPVERDEAGPYLRFDPYFACNRFCDSELGRVLEAVAEEAPDALQVYTSDHGDMLRAHRLVGKGPAMYEEILRVPLILRGPGVAAGATCPALVSHVDLVPTFLEHFGVERPPILAGRSLLSLGSDPAAPHRPVVFAEFHRFELDHDGYGAFQPIRCAFDGRHKLAVNLLDRDELYDLHEDPGEIHNRIGEDSHQAIAAELHDALLRWMDESRDPLRGPAWQRRPWRSRAVSSWGGPTRPRPADGFLPPILLYDTAEPATQPVYDKT